MCHKSFLDKKLLEFDKLPFCHVDYKKLINAELSLIKVVKTSPARPDLSVAVHEEQIRLFNEGKASYLKTSYEEKDGSIISIIKLISN